MTNMRAKYTFAVALIAAVFAVASNRAMLSAQAQKTIWEGVYSADQATRGKDKAVQACGSCHGMTLAGADLAPTLTGEDFLSHWYDAKLSELVMKVVDTMPADAPGSLKPEEYADIVAHMLQLNGAPAGQQPLKVEPAAALDAIKIVKKP